MDYFSNQGWVYIVISLIATIVAITVNIYLMGAFNRVRLPNSYFKNKKIVNQGIIHLKVDTV